MENERSRGKGPHLTEPATQRGGGPQRKQRKANSRMNAPKSGILSQETVNLETNVIGEGSQENYDCLLASYMEHFKPEGPAERHQIELAVGALWRYRRLLRAELGESWTHERELDDPCDPAADRSQTALPKRRTGQESDRLQRDEEHLLRVYNRALSELARLQRPRLGDNRKAPIAMIISMGRVTERSDHASDSQGAGPRNPKQAAIPEALAGKDKGPEEQVPSRSQRSPDQAVRDGLGRPGKRTASGPGDSS